MNVFKYYRLLSTTFTFRKQLLTSYTMAADFDKEAAVPSRACTRWEHADWQDWPEPQDGAAGHGFITWTAPAENGKTIWELFSAESFLTSLNFVFVIVFTYEDDLISPHH